MGCPTGKDQHPTREAAEEQQKKLVGDNHAHWKDERSKWLNVYLCPYKVCGAWHVGHNKFDTAPMVYHYTVGRAAVQILEAGEIRKRTKDSLLHPWQVVVEPHPLIWFSRNTEWEHSVLKFPRSSDPRQLPTGRAATEVRGLGLYRWSAPQWVAKLRWSDYLALNKIHPHQRDEMAQRGNPVEWLATDHPVSLSECGECEVYYRGRWMDPFLLSEGEIDTYLETRQEVYFEAWKRLTKKLLATDGYPDVERLDEAERIMYHDWEVECKEKDWREEQVQLHPKKVEQFEIVLHTKVKLAKIQEEREQRMRNQKKRKKR